MRLLGLLLLASALCGFDPRVRVSVNCPWDDQEGFSPLLIEAQAIEDVVLECTIMRGQRQAASARLVLRAHTPLRQTVLVPSHQTGADWFHVQWRASNGASGNDYCSSTIDHRAAHLVYVGQDPGEQQLLTDLGWASPTTLSVEDLPDRWQAYPNWLRLVLGHSALAALSPSQRAALKRWQRVCDGLRVLSDDPDWPLLDASPDRLEQWRMSLHQAEATTHHPTRHAVATSSDSIYRLFMVIALGFFFCVGPLNLWWAHRRRRLQLLYLSTPILSGLCCLLLFGIGLIGEGVSTRRSAVVLCDLDLPQQTAVRWAGISYYAPFAPGPFLLDAATRLLTLDRSTYQLHHVPHSRNISGGQLQQGPGLEARGAWIPARLHRQLVFTTPRNERRRLLIERSATGWRLSNGLGQDLSHLSWRAPDGQSWCLAHCAAGASQDLQVGDIPSADDLGRRLTPAAVWRLHQRRLQPGGFVARLQAPLEPLPGPVAIDVAPPQVVLCGLLLPEEMP